MRNILKSFLFSFIALLGAAKIIKGFSFGNDITVLVAAAFVFGMVNSFIKPLLRLVTLPLNLLTLGFSSLLANVALLYLTIRVVPGFTIAASHFPGLDFKSQYLSLALPSFDLPAAGTLLLTSAAISLIMVILKIIFEG